MANQKERIIQRFQRAAKEKNKEVRKAGLRCICGKCNLAIFKLDEIIEIIRFKDKKLESNKYKCGGQT